MKDRSGWVGTGVASVTGQGSGAAEPSRLSRGQGFREPQPLRQRQPARQAHRRHVAAPREPASPSGPAVRRARRPPWSWRQPGANARSVSQLRAARGDGQQRNGSDVVTAGGRSGPSSPRRPLSETSQIRVRGRSPARVPGPARVRAPRQPRSRRGGQAGLAPAAPAAEPPAGTARRRTGLGLQGERGPPSDAAPRNVAGATREASSHTQLPQAEGEGTKRSEAREKRLQAGFLVEEKRVE